MFISIALSLLLSLSSSLFRFPRSSAFRHPYPFSSYSHTSIHHHLRFNCIHFGSLALLLLLSSLFTLPFTQGQPGHISPPFPTTLSRRSFLPFSSVRSLCSAACALHPLQIQLLLLLILPLHLRHSPSLNDDDDDNPPFLALPHHLFPQFAQVLPSLLSLSSFSFSSLSLFSPTLSLLAPLSPLSSPHPVPSPPIIIARSFPHPFPSLSLSLPPPPLFIQLYRRVFIVPYRALFYSHPYFQFPRFAPSSFFFSS